MSLITASRVVNGWPNVTGATRERVELAIHQLGYRPNHVARMLRAGITPPTIGLVIEDIANPFYAGIAKAVEEVIRSRRSVVITSSSEEDPELEQEVVRALLQRRVDGILLVPASNGDHRYLREEARTGIPVVFLDREPVGLIADTVRLDNVGGARQAVEHLLRQGHRRIGVVGDPPSMPTAAERLSGYRLALEAHRVPYDARLVSMTSHDIFQAELSARALLSLPDAPTALFALNNRNCVGTLRAIGDERVALVGFDDLELFDLPHCRVTVVDYDLRALGRQGAELLLRRMEGDTSPPQSITLPTRLVCRGSGEVSPP